MKTSLINFFRQGTAESMKRLLGAIGFVCFIVFVALWKHDLIGLLGELSAALVGLGILDKIGGAKA